MAPPPLIFWAAHRPQNGVGLRLRPLPAGPAYDAARTKHKTLSEPELHGSSNVQQELEQSLNEDAFEP